MIHRTIEQVYSDNPNYTPIQDTAALNSDNTHKKVINIFSVQHNTIYRTAIKIFLDNAIIPIGPKNFRKVCENEKYHTYTEQDRSINGCQSHPHNTYIQLLTETGVPGFLIIFIFFLYINYIFIKKKYFDLVKKITIYNDYQLFLLLALYVTLWPIAPTGNFFHNWLNIIYFMPIGFLLHSFYNKNL